MTMARHALFFAALALCFVGRVLSLRGEPHGDVTSTRSAWEGRFAQQSLDHHGHHGHDSDEDFCRDLDWRQKSLKLIKELPVAGLFADLEGNDKFEASGLTKWKDGYVIIFDNLETLGFFDSRLEFMGAGNKLSTGPSDLSSPKESQYEAIMPRTRTGTLMALKEAKQLKHMHPVIVEMSVSDDLEWTVLRECVINFELEEINKGFEGALYYDAGDKGEYIMGMCEGNHCAGGKKGQESGNGRVVLVKLVEDGDKCTWEVEKTIKIPETANFTDYSAMDIMGDRVAITSQEDSSVWIGHIDLETFEFKEGGEVFHFPRAGHCKPVYCNVEGVHWLDSQRLITATDRAKSTQPWSCSAKDQSVQVFALPHSKHLDSAITA